MRDVEDLRPPVSAGRTASALSIATTLGLFGLLGLLADHDIPAGSRDLVNILLGGLLSGWTAIVSYYFGSSAASDHATRALAAVTANREEKP